MASACVNSAATRYGWLSSRLSFSRDDHPQPPIDHFEFRLEDPTVMLPADELFSGGKINLSSLRPQVGASARVDYSPKAPRCSSRWRELLGLKRAHQNGESSLKTRSSLKSLLQRSSRASTPTMSQPLLREVVSPPPELESVSEDPRRLSVEDPNPFKAPRMRAVKAMRRVGEESVDSPRMNPSGKIVFQSLERSSSSPSSFNGGPRLKHRGVERSYSANVRVTPVLNVPVCSLRGSSKSGSVFGMFSSPQKRENAGAGAAASTSNRPHHHHHRNRTERN